MDGSVFLTDGGVETDLIFNHGVDLPEFASFVLHENARRVSNPVFNPGAVIWAGRVGDGPDAKDRRLRDDVSRRDCR